MRRPGRRTRALTIMELLVCITITSLLVGMAGVLFIQAANLNRAQNSYYHRLKACEHLLRLFARDVHAATGFMEDYGGAPAGEKLLALRSDAGTVTYRVGDGTVTRAEGTRTATQESEALAVSGVNVRFAFDGDTPARSRSVVLTVDWREPDAIGVSHPTLSLRAALRRPSE